MKPRYVLVASFLLLIIFTRAQDFPRFPSSSPQIFPNYFPYFGGNNNNNNYPQQIPQYYQQPPIQPQPQVPNILTQFQLPKQVRVPGRIEISINGPHAEILCEFPRFLILIQKIYWHHRYDDPYGTYYDSNQHFSPHVTIIVDEKYKSILRIHNFNEDDFGHYRCLSSAILPEEDSSAQNFVPPFLRSFNFHDRFRVKRSLYNYFNSPAPSKQLFAPFYKPGVGLFSIYQEIKFAPVRAGLKNASGVGTSRVAVNGSMI